MRRKLIPLMILVQIVASCGGAPGSDPLVTAADQAVALPNSATTTTAPPAAQGSPDGASTTFAATAPTSTSTPTTQATSETTTGGTSTESSGVSTTSVSPASSVTSTSTAADYCSSGVVGLRVIVPSGWTCSNVSTPVLSGDAFAIQDEPETVRIVIGTGDEVFACSLSDACGQDPFFISEEFPDTSRFDAGGITEISGHHRSVDAYVVIIPLDPGALDDTRTEDALRAILDSAEPV